MNIEDKIQKNINLASFSTFRIGGQAKFFLEIKKKEELESALDWARKHEEKVFVLGGGSNILFPDQNFNALIIKLNNNDIRLNNEELICDAGAKLGRVVNFCLNHSVSRLEWAAGIPGTIGGAVYGNAGAFGHEISEFIKYLEIFDREDNKFKIFKKAQCQFAYRDSIFKKEFFLNQVNKIIWQVAFDLEVGDQAEMRTKIQNNLAGRKNQPHLPNAGCVFKNFYIDDIAKKNPSLADCARAAFVVKGEKVSAAWIIDKAGIKETQIGGAQVSAQHANFIVNTGEARAQDVLDLISEIKRKIKSDFNLELEEEIEIIQL